MAKREIPEINAGSMADIAFLLLIFFLVTTTMDVDKGLQRQLPIPEENPENQPKIPKRNIFEVIVNANNDLLVEGEYLEITELRAAAKDFIDNNGSGDCSYCNGLQSTSLSDKPTEAIISISNDRGTTYETYVTVQNELAAAYRELREDLARRLYGKDYGDLNEEEKEDVANKYPLVISEAEPVELQGS